MAFLYTVVPQERLLLPVRGRSQFMQKFLLSIVYLPGINLSPSWNLGSAKGTKLVVEGSTNLDYLCSASLLAENVGDQPR